MLWQVAINSPSHSKLHCSSAAMTPCLQLFLIVSALLVSASAQCTPHNSLTFLSPVTVAHGLAATPIFHNLTTPRGITFDSNQNLLVVERGLGVTSFTSSDPSCDGWLRTVVIANSGFTQGIQVHGSALYVSTSGQVLRYAYDASSRTVSGSPVVIVDGIPPDGGMHTFNHSLMRVCTSDLNIPSQNSRHVQFYCILQIGRAHV